MILIKLALIRKRIRSIPLMLKDRNVPLLKKAVLVFGIVYLFLPIDLIPPVIPVLGFFDDLIIWFLIMRWLGPELDRYDPANSANVRPKYVNKTIVDAEYTVNKEDESRNG